MLTQATVARVIEAVGGRRPTTEHDLRRACAALGYELGAFTRTPRGVANSWLPFVEGPTLARQRFDGRRHGYHWIVLTRETVHDPAFANAITRGRYARVMVSLSAHITSWAPVRRRASFDSAGRGPVQALDVQGAGG